jgi:hypothetical protein
MIRARIERDEEGKIVRICADGHALFGEKGKDIVCAAVSALLQTAAWGIKKKLKAPSSICIKEGSLSLEIEEPSEKTQAVLEVTLFGLRRIATQYGRVLVQEVRRSGS